MTPYFTLRDEFRTYVQSLLHFEAGLYKIQVHRLLIFFVSAKIEEYILYKKIPIVQ